MKILRCRFLIIIILLSGLLAPLTTPVSGFTYVAQDIKQLNYNTTLPADRYGLVFDNSGIIGSYNSRTTNIFLNVTVNDEMASQEFLLDGGDYTVFNINVNQNQSLVLIEFISAGNVSILFTEKSQLPPAFVEETTVNQGNLLSFILLGAIPLILVAIVFIALYIDNNRTR